MNPLDLPVLREISESFEPPLSLWAVLDLHAGLHVALGFGALFWPRFIERDGQVFLAERYSAEIYDQWAALDSVPPEDRERTLNHVHLWDLFGSHEDQREAEAYLALGQILQRTWSAALREEYPDRAFSVLFEEDIDGADYGPTLTFWQT